VSRRNGAAGVESVMRATKIAVASATGRVEGYVVDVLEVRGYATLAGPTLEQWLDTAAVVILGEMTLAAPVATAQLRHTRATRCHA
jgi:hypothetical protein